jgi:hypothetical protein
MRRCRVQCFEIAEDGTLELPAGAAIVSLEFESEGAYGYRPHPVAVWAEVPAESPS